RLPSAPAPRRWVFKETASGAKKRSRERKKVVALAARTRDLAPRNGSHSVSHLQALWRAGSSPPWEATSNLAERLHRTPDRHVVSIPRIVRRYRACRGEGHWRTSWSLIVTCYPLRVERGDG